MLRGLNSYECLQVGTYTSSLFPAIMPSTNPAAHQRLVSYTRHGSSQLSLLHLPLERFTAYAVKPAIGSKSRFLPIPFAFDAPIGGGVLSEYCHAVWYGKTRMMCVYPTVKNFWRYGLFVSTERTNVTDTQIYTDIAWRLRPPSYSIARQKPVICPSVRPCGVNINHKGVFIATQLNSTQLN